MDDENGTIPGSPTQLSKLSKRQNQHITTSALSPKYSADQDFEEEEDEDDEVEQS